MKVPYLDLDAHHAPYRSEFTKAIEEVVDSGSFAGGPFVQRFEEDFAEFCEVEHAIGVGSGTDALWLALTALGIGPGDEVITVPMTFFATVEAISRTGARPVFVDIDEASYTLDTGLLEAAVTSRTKAILPVHLFGRMADMEPILQFAEERGILVVEDAAQAHGAKYQGRRAGSLANAGCFSFYPGKNLGAFGEAGAVTTSDSELAKKVRILRDHGQNERYQHAVIGWNCRMDGIQAAVLNIKLRNLELNNRRRRHVAERYSEAFDGLNDLALPAFGETERHVHHIYAIRVPDRSAFLGSLEAEGIGYGIHYPVPIHLQPSYTHLGYSSGSFPVSEQAAEEFVSLPMFPELTDSQIEMVISAVERSCRVKIPA